MVLELRDVRVRYANGALGILDVSLSVQDGATVAFFGPNGAGKSTTSRAISGFLKTEGARIIGGDVVFDGKRINGLEPHRVARLGIALVPERNKVFPNLSVHENLGALGTRPVRARRAELTERVYELFPILDRRRHQAAGRLSGGERQMLAIGRAMLLDPKMLVIDEMTLGLHHSLQQPLYAAVSRIAGDGTSVLIVDENSELAIEVADYFYEIREGRVVDHGSADSFTREETYAEEHGVTG